MKYALLFFLIPLFIQAQIQVGQKIIINARDVEISSDGGTIAILEDTSFNSETLIVKTYVILNSVWTTNVENDIIIEDISIGNSSLRMSQNGKFLMIGSSNEQFDGIGIVRVFENINGQWNQIGQDLKTGIPLDTFGRDGSSGNRTEITPDGSIIAIGAVAYYGDGTFGDSKGLVRVFKNIQGTWEQMGSDLVGDVGDRLGSAVALSEDGLIMGVGISGVNNQTGQVKIYKFENNDWIQIGNDINGENENDLLGFRLRISADGNRFAISSQLAGNGSLSYTKVYDNVNDNWIQLGEAIRSDGVSIDLVRSGGRISLSSDGSVLALSSLNGPRIYKINDNAIQFIDIKTGSLGSIMNLSSNGSHIIVEENSEVIVYNIEGNTLSTEDIVNLISSTVIYQDLVKDRLNIKLDLNNSLDRLKIFTIGGKNILTTKDTSINLSSLDSGIYIIQIETGQGRMSKKIIIE